MTLQTQGAGMTSATGGYGSGEDDTKGIELVSSFPFLLLTLGGPRVTVVAWSNIVRGRSQLLDTSFIR